MNLIVWKAALDVAADHPNLSVKPGPMPDVSVADLAGPRIDCAGISLQVPWRDAVEEHHTTFNAISSTQQEAVMVASFEEDRIRALRGTTPRESEVFKAIFDKQGQVSDYSFMFSEVWTVPSEINWLESRLQNARALTMLTSKSVDMGDSGAIYELRSGDVRGFQFGDPALTPYRVRIDLFDAKDNHCKVAIVGRGDKRPVISQAQLNGMVASVRALAGS